MEWLVNLFTDSSSVAHVITIYSFVIALGVWLGKRKLFGVSLGVTFVLFIGILVGHFLLHNHYKPIEENWSIIGFLQDFGLILFVYSIGIQVGPSFFSSFKEGGVRLNLLALGIILLNITVMLVLYYAFTDTNDPRTLPMMVGVLCGAVTNTPGLGAANAALEQVYHNGTAPVIANGYACAYPLGVVGIIASMIIIKLIFKVSFKKEEEDYNSQSGNNAAMKPHMLQVEITNDSLNDKTILQIRDYLARDFVCSRLLHEGHTFLPNKETRLHVGDKAFIVCAEDDAEAIVAFLGKEVEVDWEHQDLPMVSKKITITRENVDGKTLGSFHPSSLFGVNVTRLYRSGIELFAQPNVTLQVGDRLTVVGPSDAVERFANRMGNQTKSLDKPNLVTIFVGILLGIIVGCIPFNIGGMSMPVKLGLAGGPLIVAIIIGRFGYRFHLIAYTTNSASMMIRDIGLALFLASVGIKAGGNFVDTVMNGGLNYVLYGFLITIIPLLLIGIFARVKYKTNYFLLMGLIAGSTTDPPALAYSTTTANNDIPSIGYSTVYPLTMFMRIITAQVLILMFCS